MQRHPVFAVLYDRIMTPLGRVACRPHRRRTAAFHGSKYFRFKG